MPSHDREPAALRQRCCLQPKAELAEVVRLVLAHRPESKGLAKPYTCHPGSVVGHDNSGRSIIAGDLDGNTTSPGDDGVVHQVGDRGDEVVPDIPERSEKSGGRGRDVRCSRVTSGHGFFLL